MTVRSILMLMCGAALLLPIGCKQEATAPKPAPVVPPPPEKTWSSEEISKDPVGYLQAQDRQVERQIQERGTRQQQLADRHCQIQDRQAKLIENLKEIKNVYNRLQTACRKADDEDRWPARMGGRTFDRAKAEAILKSAEQYIKDRQPLAEAYEQTLNRIADLEARTQKETQDLARLRERIALDIERIRLNQGIAELGELRRTETELASFSKMLGALDENAVDTAVVAATDAPPRVDVEKLLK